MSHLLSLNLTSIDVKNISLPKLILNSPTKSINFISEPTSTYSSNLNSPQILNTIYKTEENNTIISKNQIEISLSESIDNSKYKENTSPYSDLNDCDYSDIKTLVSKESNSEIYKDSVINENSYSTSIKYFVKSIDAPLLKPINKELSNSLSSLIL